jgi:hypothetical protein
MFRKLSSEVIKKFQKNKLFQNLYSKIMRDIF